MWPFFLNRVAYFEKRYDAALTGQILSLLRNSLQHLRLSPLVLAINQDENDPNIFKVTERLPLFWGLQSTTTFQSHLINVDRDMEQGTNNDIQAPLGTTMRVELRVEERSEGSSRKEVWVCEKVEVRGIFFLMPYIYRTMSKAQRDVLDTIEERALALHHDPGQ